MASKTWNDTAEKFLFFTILSVKNIGVISGAEWTTIGGHMRTMGYGFTNEGCRYVSITILTLVSSYLLQYQRYLVSFYSPIRPPARRLFSWRLLSVAPTLSHFCDYRITFVAFHCRH